MAREFTLQAVVEHDPKFPQYDDVFRSAVVVREGDKLTQSAWLIGRAAEDVLPSITQQIRSQCPGAIITHILL